jgi:hypothetical protein
MRRILLSSLVGLTVVAVAAAQAQEPRIIRDLDELEATVRYVNDLQGTDGGFRPSADDRVSQVGATSAAMRALKYLGGRPRNKDGVAQFVRSCYQPASGGFADTPGGQPTVRSAAMGLMAAVEAKLAMEEIRAPVEAYFAKHAGGNLGDTYIAAAALDAAQIDATKAAEWIAAFQATRNDDGTYGKTIADTAGAVVTILRLRGEIKDRPRVGEILKAAQRPDGGFSAAADNSDLATTYRVMRAFYMLKGRPDIARCRDFLARCRNRDGGYGPGPGQPSTVSTTYFACIILHWLDEMESGG